MFREITEYDKKGAFLFIFDLKEILKDNLSLYNLIAY
jgi:hypothetical protein